MDTGASEPLEIVVSKLAVNDLDDIWSFIAEDNPVSADRFIDELISKIELLAAHPNFGHRHRNINHQNMKVYTHKKYLIIFNVDRSHLNVVRIVSGYRNLPELFKN